MQNYGLPPGVGFLTGKSGLRSGRPTLVLIHGAGGSARSFLPQIRGLDRSMNILALELPGHGKTPGPGRASIASYADWVHETLTGFSLDTFYMGGHSMGGAICLEMGLRYPGKIQGLILIATGATLKVSTKILEGLKDQPSRTLTKINRWSFAKGTNPQVIAQSVKLMEQIPIPIILGDFQACDRFYRQIESSAIRAPTLILSGDQDIMAPPGTSHLLRERMPFSREVVVPGAGHMVMLERYRDVNQAILDFVIN
jgi:pimeloyl-ACP methyl ester carboxylesterase